MGISLGQEIDIDGKVVKVTELLATGTRTETRYGDARISLGEDSYVVPLELLALAANYKTVYKPLLYEAMSHAVERYKDKPKAGFRATMTAALEAKEREIEQLRLRLRLRELDG